MKKTKKNLFFPLPPAPSPGYPQDPDPHEDFCPDPDPQKKMRIRNPVLVTHAVDWLNNHRRAVSQGMLLLLQGRSHVVCNVKFMCLLLQGRSHVAGNVQSWLSHDDPLYYLR